MEDSNEKADDGRARIVRDGGTSEGDRWGAGGQGETGDESGRGRETTPLVGDVSKYGGLSGGIQRGGRLDKKQEVASFGSYSIHNCHNEGLKSELCRMYQANIDLGILLEKKITGGVYMR